MCPSRGISRLFGQTRAILKNLENLLCLSSPFSEYMLRVGWKNHHWKNGKAHLPPFWSQNRLSPCLPVFLVVTFPISNLGLLDRESGPSSLHSGAERTPAEQVDFGKNAINHNTFLLLGITSRIKGVFKNSLFFSFSSMLDQDINLRFSGR